MTQLPRNPSSLDLLIVRRYTENGSNFRDFHVRREKVMRALLWLKGNNKYYHNIVIDNDILQTLPENGSIAEQLPQLTNDRTHHHEEGPNEQREDLTEIDDESDEAHFLNRMQHDQENSRIEWPRNETFPVDEFHTPGYIARAFPTLYPYGTADLNDLRVKEIKPAEYFKHLLIYKDGQFARHPRWRYFALNTIMRQRALSEGRVFVKQNLEEGQLTMAEILELMENDTHIVDRIMRYGDGLRGTCQYWIRCRGELLDMIKQIGSQGIIFFTFSAANMHWPELHDLMPNGENVVEAETVQEATKRRRKDLIDNPHIAAWFFEK